MKARAKLLLIALMVGALAASAGAIELSHPADVSYIQGSGNYWLTWDVNSADTQYYARVTKDGWEREGGVHPSSIKNITIDVATLHTPVGVYTYVITVNDSYGTATDTVVVTITNLPPTLSHPADVSYMQGSGNYGLTWDVNSMDTRYLAEVTENGRDRGGGWLQSSTKNITREVATPNTPSGVYTYIITVRDSYGTATDTVVVTIATPPTVSNPADVTYVQGRENCQLVWDVDSMDTRYHAEIKVDGGFRWAGWKESPIKNITMDIDTSRIGVRRYDIIVTDSYGNASDTVLVTITAPHQDIIDIIDWSGVDVEHYADPRGDMFGEQPAPGVDITDCYAAADWHYLYGRIDIAQPQNNFYLGLCIDDDRDDADDRCKFDYNLASWEMRPFVEKYNPESKDWEDFIDLAQSDVTNSSTVYQFRVDLFALGVKHKAAALYVYCWALSNYGSKPYPMSKDNTSSMILKVDIPRPPDADAPLIDYTYDNKTAPPLKNITLTTTITDKSPIETAQLYYLPYGNKFKSIDMEHKGSDYSATIPFNDVHDGATIYFYFYANDSYGNAITNPIGASYKPAPAYYLIQVKESGSADQAPPTIRLIAPENGTTLPLQQYVEIKLETNEAANCSWAHEPGANYPNMHRFSTADSLNHSTYYLELDYNTTYNFYIKCNDSAGNVNPTDAYLYFSIEPASEVPERSDEVAGADNTEEIDAQEQSRGGAAEPESSDVEETFQPSNGTLFDVSVEQPSLEAPRPQGIIEGILSFITSLIRKIFG